MVSKFHQTAFALHERPRQHRVKWWRHESDIYKMLGLDSVDELDEFVKSAHGSNSARNAQNCTLVSNGFICCIKFLAN